MPKKPFSVLLFFMLAFSLAAPLLEAQAADSPDAPKKSSPVVYTAGWYEGRSYRTPCYWKNSQRFDLPGNWGNVSSIFLAEGHVYICGSYAEGSTSIPCYWIDAQRVDLDMPRDGKYKGGTSAIFVEAGKVYTTGFITDGSRKLPLEDDRLGRPVLKFTACYWVGTTRTDLPGNEINSVAKAIFVDGGKIYTAGVYWSQETDPRMVPCYWVDQTKIDLICNQVKSGQPSGIWVANSTVYVSGNYSSLEDNAFGEVACYWKNGVLTNLTRGTQVTTTGLRVENGIVYESGFYVNEGAGGPCYWKDKQIVQLPCGEVRTTPNAICVTNGIVYTAGYVASHSKLTPCYWIGNTRVDLPCDGKYGAVATGIAVLNQ
jgi:hypothetical protein